MLDQQVCLLFKSYRNARATSLISDDNDFSLATVKWSEMRARVTTHLLHWNLKRHESEEEEEEPRVWMCRMVTHAQGFRHADCEGAPVDSLSKLVQARASINSSRGSSKPVGMLWRAFRSFRGEKIHATTEFSPNERFGIQKKHQSDIHSSRELYEHTFVLPSSSSCLHQLSAQDVLNTNANFRFEGCQRAFMRKIAEIA